MSRRAGQPADGVPKRLPLRLSDNVAKDLWAFCEAHYGAPQTRIIEEALRHFIGQELDSDPHLRERFEALRARGREDSRPTLISISPPAKN